MKDKRLNCNKDGRALNVPPLSPGRKPTWNTRECITIRIPCAIKDQVIAYARALDAEMKEKV